MTETKNTIEQRFLMTKKHHQETLNQAIKENKADKPIIPFLLKVSKIKDIFTSSSCSGRIMLLSTDSNENKKFSSFHKRFHRLVEFKEIKNAINESNENELWLKVEPFIFHFGCEDLEKAKEILEFSKEFGLKKAGIITAKPGRFILEITSTQYLALPVKINNQLLFDDSYLETIIKKANHKLDINFKRLEKFEKEFLKKFS